MCDLTFVKVSDFVCWGQGIIELVNKNNPKTTKIINNELFIREDVVKLVSPELETKADILRRCLTDKSKKDKK